MASIISRRRDCQDTAQFEKPTQPVIAAIAERMASPRGFEPAINEAISVE